MATAAPPASEAAAEILRKGGNAIDAAVTAAFVLGVVQPYDSGIGGGGMALVYTAKDHKLAALDFRETAPAKATPHMFGEQTATHRPSRDGALGVATPGAVAGYLELLHRFGTRTRGQVIAPAIRWAREGYVVGSTARLMTQERVHTLRRDPEAQRLFLGPPDTAGLRHEPEVGSRIVQMDLAHTLEVIAEKGADGFYQGPVAEALVKGVQARGGILSLEDMKAFKVRERQPLWGSYRGHALATLPPPSAGGTQLLQMLDLLELRDPKNQIRGPDRVHLLIEIMRRSFADRALSVGDPAFVPDPSTQLLSKQHLLKLVESIDPGHATACSAVLPTSSPAPISPSWDGPDTTHISVVDGDGNMISLTTTVNFGFGSCVVPEGTGVLLNDEMDDFADAPGHANSSGLVSATPNLIAPGKIPASSMTPTLVFSDDKREKPWFTLGAPGGPRIPTAVFQVIASAIDERLSPTEAMRTPRVHHQCLPDVVRFEGRGFPEEMRQALTDRGHVLKITQRWGNVQMVEIDPTTGLRRAACDTRGYGEADAE